MKDAAPPDPPADENPMLATIAKRLEVIDRLGPRLALRFFIAETKRKGSPTWAHQEEVVKEVLTAADYAAWNRARRAARER